jgi:RNA polymerase sigma factor (sigma-70 family)
MGSSDADVSEDIPPERGGGSVDRERAEALVLGLVAAHADSLLRVARRYSLCADDAHDAYQRGLEILMRHAARLDPERAAGWLHTVVKREALAINRSRRRALGVGDVDPDALEARTSASPEERALSADRVARSAEALQGLKPQEVRALWLKALGHSYQQICDVTGWTYTKVNRCLAEGRKSFLERYAGIESGAECERLAPVLSALVDGEASAAQTVQLRAHLRQCLACRATVRGLHDASRPLTVVLPAVGIAVAAGGAEPSASFFLRVYETVTLHLHERAANAFLRAQAIVDTAAAGKMAAVAASAAAVAGGGFAVGGAITTPAGDRPGIALRGVAGAAAPQPRHRRTVAHQAPSGVKAQRRHARSSAAPRAASTPAASPPTTQPRRPAASPPATTATSAASGGGSTAGEFGFEGP